MLTRSDQVVIESVVLLDLGSQSARQRAGLALRVQGVELVLHAGARAENEMAASFNPGEQLLQRGVRR